MTTLLIDTIVFRQLLTGCSILSNFVILNLLITALSADWFHLAHLSSHFSNYSFEQCWLHRIRKYRSDEWQCITHYSYLSLAKILISKVVEKEQYISDFQCKLFKKSFQILGND